MMTDHHLQIMAQRPAHRRKQHDRIGTSSHRRLGLGSRRSGLLLIDTGDDQPIAHHVFRDFDNPFFLIAGQQEIFAGMTVDQETQQPVDLGERREVGGECCLINRRSIAPHRADGRRIDPEETSFFVGRHATTPSV